MSKQEQKVDSSESGSKTKPADVYGIVYILFYLMGLVHVLPWTFFVTAHDYWMYKFRNTTLDDIDPSHRTTLQTEFSPSLTITLQLSSITFLILSLFFSHKLPLNLRIFGPLGTTLACFILASAFILVDTDAWQVGFFALTMLTVAIINAMGAVFGLATLSLLSNFPEEYLAPYINGQGVATIFTAVLQIASLAVGISIDSSALVYFWVAIGVIAFTLVLLTLVIKFNKFFRHHIANYVEKKKTFLKPREIVDVLKIIWPAPANMLFWLLTVQPVHPVVTSLVVSEGKGNGEWNDVYFLPVITFLLTAVTDFFGRILSFKIKYNLKFGWLVVFSALRVFIFVPLIMLCNAHPRHHLPVVFPHDYQFVIILAAFSVTNGYLLAMTTAMIPRLVPPEKLEDAFHVLTVSTGIILGVLSFVSFVSLDFL